ncbi:MAG: AAA family ATPase, partial [Armatimonadetes bacterium]|nr:AAA family ATPase [Armatimonadota bacterium]
GGVGKTTTSALLARLFQRAGYRVLLLDADPDANLAATLGFPDPEGITPIVAMKELIKERMGVDNLESVGTFFRMNPRVDDIPDRYSAEHDGLRLMVMGPVRQGGSGCACPQNTFVRQLLSHLLLERQEVVILDMEAGIEHLGRGTAGAVDLLLVVVEPGLRSIETAGAIRKLAADIGVQKVWAIANKVRGERDREFIRSQMRDWKLLCFLPYSEDVAATGRGERTLSPDALDGMEEIRKAWETVRSI